MVVAAVMRNVKIWESLKQGARWVHKAFIFVRTEASRCDVWRHKSVLKVCVTGGGTGTGEGGDS